MISVYVDLSEASPQEIEQFYAAPGVAFAMNSLARAAESAGAQFLLRGPDAEVELLNSLFQQDS